MNPDRKSRPRQRYCYVEFEVAGDDALARLSTVVLAMAADRMSGRHRNENQWLEFFSEQELSHFWWPDEAERAEWEDYSRAVDAQQPSSGEMPEPPWDFMSMIWMITQDCDHDLIGVRRTEHNRGVLEFNPGGYPYGGAGALRALVRAFGHVVVGCDDGTGYVEGDPEPPRWAPKSSG